MNALHRCFKCKLSNVFVEFLIFSFVVVAVAVDTEFFAPPTVRFFPVQKEIDEGKEGEVYCKVKR